ncbi:CCA tRNA nucleotidyltransferase, mitochondrial [Puttea exsequens]|nr:CCA tRNA nucleotidyltransferase, mitochondrial [Puttea exsequens]
MARSIALTAQEETLKQLLLDVSTYISTRDGCKRPQLRFTGGWVRDKLLGFRSQDIDIGIDSMTGYDFGKSMEQFLAQPGIRERYPENVLGTLAKIEANPEKSKNLATATTKMLGLGIDLVNLRKETYSADSRNPQMEFGTPTEDAFRRDATVNALFYNLETSQLEDLTGRGLKDMQRRVLKTPLPALQTFKDDPLRMLRVIRFASRLKYDIAEEDEAAMRDSSIKAALKLKISRERVGVEIVKMLKGPDPHTALRLIHRLGLYNDIFTDPTDPDCVMASDRTWKGAYDQLLSLTKANEYQDADLQERKIARILLRDRTDDFHAWMVACFVPWAGKKAEIPGKSTMKRLPSPAGIAAREGIKATNSIYNIVDNAAAYLQDVIVVKESTTKMQQLNTVPSQRKQESDARVAQGQAIRTWGAHWRSSVMFALLTQIAETPSGTGTQFDDLHWGGCLLTSPGSAKLLDGYAKWLSYLEKLNLLDVDQLKPTVNGKQVSEALGGPKSGPWMKKALDIAFEWQLRNPDESDPTGGITEVVERKGELGLL